MRKLLTLLFVLGFVTNVYAEKEYAQRYPTGTALEVYSPNNPPPGMGEEVDPHAVWLEGRSGGQTIKGGTGGGESLSFWTNATGELGNYYFTDLTDNGFVKTSGGSGKLVIDTNTYLDTTTAGTTYFKIDQTVPQTIINGSPIFDLGWTSNGGFVNYSNSIQYDNALYYKDAEAALTIRNTNLSSYSQLAIGVNTAGGYSYIQNKKHNLGTELPFTIWGNLEELARFNTDGTVKLNHYTTDGFVKFINSNGTLGIDNTIYLSAETDPLSWLKSSDQTLLTGDKSGSFDLTTTGTVTAEKIITNGIESTGDISVTSGKKIYTNTEKTSYHFTDVSTGYTRFYYMNTEIMRFEH